MVFTVEGREKIDGWKRGLYRCVPIDYEGEGVSIKEITVDHTTLADLEEVATEEEITVEEVISKILMAWSLDQEIDH